MARPLVLVTGASSGIGHALALEGAKRGYDVIAIARRAERLNQLKAEIMKLHPECSVETLVADVTAPDYPAKLRALLPEERELKMAIVNAGIGSAGKFDKITMEIYESVLKTNVLAAICTSQIVLPNLKKARGHLGFVGSLNGHIANPLSAAYSTSKFALRGFAETLRAELWHHGIRVSLISPGPVETEIFSKDHNGTIKADPLPGRKRLPADIAARRIFDGMLSDRRDFSLTFKTNLALVFARTFPGTLSWIFRKFYGKYEAKFLRLVAKINPESV